MDEIPTGHKNGTHAVIIMMLVALLALETATLGYVVTRTGTSTLPIATTESAILPPLLFVEKTYPDAPFGNKLHEIDRVTGEKKLILDRGLDFVELVAVPQVGFDGRVFVNLLGEGSDFNPLNIYQLDLSKPGVAPVELSAFAPGEHIAPSQARVSPDQTKIAYIPFNVPELSGAPPAPTLRVFDLLTGKTEIMGNVGDGIVEPHPLYAYGTFIQSDENAIGGFGPVAFEWKDNSCVISRVWGRPTTITSIGNKTFCLE